MESHVFDLDRIVEQDTGETNSSSNHPLRDSFGMNPDYQEFADTNGARLARPLTAPVLNRVENLNNYVDFPLSPPRPESLVVSVWPTIE